MSEPTEKQKINIVYIVGILVFAYGIMLASVGPGIALPKVLTGMNAMSYYALISVIGSAGMMLVMPMAGKLYAIFGMRKVLLFGIALQLLARIGCMLSTSYVPLLVFYLFAAMGGGFQMPAPYSLMATTVTPETRTRYFGFITTVNAIGMLTAPLITGIITDAGYMIWAFVMYSPITLIALILMFTKIPTQKQPGAAKGFDFLSIILLFASLGCILLWLNLVRKNFTFDSIPSIIMIVVGIVGFILLIRRTLTISNPSVPFGMLKGNRFRTSFICAFTATAYATAATTYATMYVQRYLESGSATLAGTVTLPQTIVTMVGGIVIGGYLARNFVLKFRLFGVLGLTANLAAVIILFFLTPTSPMIQIWLATAIGGFGQTIITSGFPAFYQKGMKREEIPGAQSMYSFASMGGSSIFGACAGMILNAGATPNYVFLTAAILIAIGLIVAIGGFRFTQEEIAEAKAAAAK